VTLHGTDYRQTRLAVAWAYAQDAKCFTLTESKKTEYLPSQLSESVDYARSQAAPLACFAAHED